MVMIDAEECERCGRKKLTDTHDRICQPTPFEGDDVCPMCGEEYESYTEHVRECGGGIE